MKTTNIKNVNSVWQQWINNSIESPEAEAVIHWTIEDPPVRWTFSSLIEQANYYSNHLIDNGVKPGDVCAIILRHNSEFYPLYMGIVGIGALPAVLAYPNRKLHPEKFQQGIQGMSQRSGLDWILTEKALDGMIRPLVSEKGSTIREIIFPLEFSKTNIPDHNQKLDEIRNLFKRDDPVLLQHSSGTTGLQKPVLLSNGAILDHIYYYGKSIELSKEDKITSWLPLYHDMGLIATFHLPLALGIPLIKQDPFEWILGPEILIEAISKEKATLTWLPNFAYNVLSEKIHDDELDGLSLNSLRLIINCSEPVRHTSHEKFFSRFKKYGLSKESLSTCYAMAETTFAITQNPPGKKVIEIAVSQKQFSKGSIKITNEKENSRICVSSGSLIDGCKILIVDENRMELPDGAIGEIAVQSISMFDGYRNYPEKTSEVLKDGWFYTGDYGFRIDGEYFIIGRKKDIIIVAGKNIYPEDIEDVVNGIKGIIPGRVIAYGEDNEETGTQSVCVIAETIIEDKSDRKKLANEIRRINLASEISISKIFLVSPKWLIKSSAGKPSRKANQNRINKEIKKHNSKIKNRNYLSFASLSLALLCLIASTFFFIKHNQTEALLGGFINDALQDEMLNNEEIALRISDKIFRETNNFVERDELDWYSQWEATSFFNMTSAVGLEYNTFGIQGEPGDGPCGTMTKIFLVAMWELNIPARKLQLEAVNERGGHTLAEFYYKGKWRVISPSDSSFVWRDKKGNIATVDQIQDDSEIFQQIYNYKSDWPYSFEYPTNINWDKLPSFLPSIIKSIIGEAAFENTETPSLYERPRKLLSMFFIILMLIFLIISYLFFRKMKKMTLSSLNY